MMMGCVRSYSSLGLLGMITRGYVHVFLLTRIVIEAGNLTSDPTPYLLFSTQHAIYRRYLDSNTSESLLTPSSLGLLGLSYHLKLDHIFWINSLFLRPAIMAARLDGSGEREIVAGNLTDPADLAVDWLNDRLYWVDRNLRQIGEYDLNTRHRSIVITTGEPGSSHPAALALYPYPNYGWIYWADGRKLEKVSVTGDDRSTLRTDLECVQVLTIDYASASIYWIDHCLYEIQSLRLDGDERTHSFPFETVIIFASGLVIYHNRFFWSEYSGVFEIAHTEDEEAVVTTIHTVQRGLKCTGVQLVHPSMQPQVEEFIKIINATNDNFTFECSPECDHGSCITPGLCACNAGWRGQSCNRDVNECKRQNGGCEFICSNTVGSFECSCPVGYTLAEDGLSCKDVNQCMDKNGGCEQLCVDLPGAYRCSCFDGYLLAENNFNCTVSPTITMTSSVTYSSNNELDYLVNIFSDSITIPNSFATAISSVAVASTGSYGTITSSETSKAIPGMPPPTFTLSTITSMTLTTDTTTGSVPIQTQTEVSLMHSTTAEIHHHTSAVLLRTSFSLKIARDLLPTRTKSIVTEVTVSKHVSLDSMVSATDHNKLSTVHHHSSVLHERFSSVRPTLRRTTPSSLETTADIIKDSNIPSHTPPTSTSNLPVVEVHSTSRGRSKEEVTVIVTVSVVACCLFAASVVLIGIVLASYAAGRRKHKTGSYSPNTNPHNLLNFNVFLTKILRSFSYS